MFIMTNQFSWLLYFVLSFNYIFTYLMIIVSFILLVVKQIYYTGISKCHSEVHFRDPQNT